MQSLIGNWTLDRVDICEIASEPLLPCIFRDEQKLVQKQLAYILGRLQIFLELDEEAEDVEDLAEIVSNSHLNNSFLALAREVKFIFMIFNTSMSSDIIHHRPNRWLVASDLFFDFISLTTNQLLGPWCNVRGHCSDAYKNRKAFHCSSSAKVNTEVQSITYDNLSS